MCWLSDYKPIKQIASADLEVFKVVIVKNGDIFSPIYRHIWHMGVTCIIELDKPEKKLPDVSGANFYWEINHGFHSFASIEALKREYKMESSVAFTRAILPKGTCYYINRFDEVVSDQLKIVDFIENC